MVNQISEQVTLQSCRWFPSARWGWVCSGQAAQALPTVCLGCGREPFWVCVTAQGWNLKVLFSQPLSLSRKAAGRIHLLCTSSLCPSPIFGSKAELRDRWYFKSQRSGVTFFHGCYSFLALQIHLFLSNFSGIIVKDAQDSFTVLVVVWMRLCHLCRTTMAFTKKHLSESDPWFTMGVASQLEWTAGETQHRSCRFLSCVQSGSSLCCYINYQMYLQCPIPTMPEFLIIFP